MQFSIKSCWLVPAVFDNLKTSDENKIIVDKLDFSTVPLGGSKWSTSTDRGFFWHIWY